MRFEDPPIVGRFLRRYKRFFADVEVDGDVVIAHCPNTGSLLGCKEEGAPAWLRDSKDDKRKLRLSWQAIQVGEAWVNVDTNLPNRVVAEALEAGQVPGLESYTEVKREVKYGENSRIDVLLRGEGLPDAYVEVKNTTLAEGATGLFPDAVTARGLKHLGELAKVVADGHRAVQLFFVSRDDVDVFRPADAIDPAYANALRDAAEAGVEVRAFTTDVQPTELNLARELEIVLGERVAVAVGGPKRRAKKTTRRKG